MNQILKSLLVLLLLNISISAYEFKEFLANAVETSSFLHSSSMSIEQAHEEGKKLTRYKNPSLALEVSQFSPDTGSAEKGYRTSYMQAIRLWGVGVDKEHLAESINSSAKTLYIQNKAKFIRDISLLYTNYSEQIRLVSLADEAREIAKRIYEISNARYESGTISRGKMLQAKIDYEILEIQKGTLLVQSNQSHYKLLKYAGIDKEITLDEKYKFKIKSASKYANPDIAYINAQKKEAISLAKMNSNKIEWVNLYAEYEKEPNQNIARVGLNVPLALFNTKSEERQIASLEAKKSELLINNENKRSNIEIRKLQKERFLLTQVQSKYEKILKSELELLAMFEDGYKIANIKLLELQDIKNRVIESKKELIQIDTALNQNAIYTNYNQGNYNE